MAKFCGNCGAELPDDAKICGQCGAPLDGSAKTPGATYVDPEKQKKLKQLIVIAAGAVAAIILLVIVINLIGGATGPKSVVKKVMKAYEKGNTDALVEMSSDIYLEMDDDYAENHFDDIIDSDMYTFEDKLGGNFDIKYKIVDSYDMKERNFNNEVEYFENYYEDYDVDSLKKIHVVEVEITGYKDKKDKTIERSIWLFKEGGKWKLYDMFYTD